MSDIHRSRVQLLSIVLTVAFTLLGWVWVFAGERRLVMDRLQTHESRLASVSQEQKETLRELIEIRAEVRWIRQTLEQRRQP